MRLFHMLGILMLFILIMPFSAEGHAIMERSVPLQDAVLEQSPDAIRIQLTEDFDPALSQVKLTDEKGNVIKGTQSVEADRWLIYTIPELAKGNYLVEWQTLSVDTHIADGSFRFSVAVPIANKPSGTISLDDNSALSQRDATNAGEQSGEAPAAVATAENQKDRETAAVNKSSNMQTNTQTGKEQIKQTVKVPVKQPVQESISQPPKKPDKAVPQPDALPDEPDDKAEYAALEKEPIQSNTNADSASALSDTPANEEQASDETGALSADQAGSKAEDNPDTVEAAADKQAVFDATGSKDGTAAVLADDLAAADNVQDHEHQHGGEGTDWRQAAYAFLRIAEVLAAVTALAYLCFKYLLWREPSLALPAIFTLKKERLLMTGAILIYAIAGSLHIWILADQLNLAGTNSLLEVSSTILTSTKIGEAIWLRLALALLLLFLPFAPNKDQRLANIVKGLAGLGILITFPLSGHASASGGYTGLAMSAHLLHMAAAAVWFGGLLGILAVTNRGHVHRLEGSQLIRVVNRFSAWALLLIIAVAISGIVLTVLRIGNWKELYSSSYGLLILAKIAILLLVVAIGAFHRLVFMPKLAIALPANESASSESFPHFVRGVRLEVSLALAAFIFAGLLSSTAPPVQSAMSEPMYWHVMGAQAHMSLRMSEESKGSQAFKLDVWLPEEVGVPSKVDIRLTELAQFGSNTVEVPLIYQSGGPDPYGYDDFYKYTYQAKDSYLKEPGSWRFSVTITDSTGEQYDYMKEIVYPYKSE